MSLLNQNIVVAEREDFTDLLLPVFEGFEVIALRSAAMGYLVFPCDAFKKKASIKKFPELATTDPTRIHEWALKFPNASCGLLATRTGHLFIDEDSSAEFRAGYETFYREPFPQTRATESRPNHRQSHWLQTDYSRTKLRNITQDKTRDKMFSLRFHHYLVLGEGSQHPSGSFYRVVVDAPAVPIPDRLVDYILSLVVDVATPAKTTTVTQPRPRADESDLDVAFPPRFDVILSEPGRNDGVSSFAWWAWQNKTHDIFEELVRDYNEKHCQPPLDDDEVESIINGKKDKPVTGANAIINPSWTNAKSNQETAKQSEPIEDVNADAYVDATVDAATSGATVPTATTGVADIFSDVSDETQNGDDSGEPLPPFPMFTGSLAELSNALCPDAPWEFKFMAAVSWFGLFRSGIDVLANEPFKQTRFYTGLIAGPGKGKTAAVREVRNIMMKLFPKGFGVFKHTSSIDSGPGLVKMFCDMGDKALMQTNKGDKLAGDSGFADRCVMMCDTDEMKGLFDKGKELSTSKNSIFDEFLKLFEDNLTENSAKSNRNAQYCATAHLGFVGGATTANYPRLWVNTGGGASGLQSRWTLIGTNAARMPSTQRPSDTQGVGEAIVRLTKQLSHLGRRITTTPEADKMFADWEATVPQKDIHARTADMVKRLLIVVAASNDLDTIDAGMMEAGVGFGSYLQHTQARYNPSDSWGADQAFENRILDTLKKAKMLNKRGVQRLVHPERYPGGYKSFNNAWSALESAEAIEEIEVNGSKREVYRVS